MNILELFDFIWISQNCMKYSEEIPEYFGSDFNSSKILRYTTLSADEDSLYDCDIDIDLLKSFSKYLNLNLVFKLADSENNGKLGVKVGDVWVNGSMASLSEDKVDYLCDYAHLEPEHIGEIKATPTLHEIYELAIGMRRLPFPKTFASLFDQFDQQVWLSICISLLVVSIYGAIYIYRKTKASFFLSFQRSFTYFFSRNIANNTGSQHFSPVIVIVWLLYSLLICESFKSVLLSNLVRQPTFALNSFEELANMPKDYLIYVPVGTPTYYRLVEHANSKREDSVHFKRVLDRATRLAWAEMHSFDKVKEYGQGKCAFLYTSLKFEGFLGLNYKNEFSNTLVQFDKVKDVRLIRKDYEYSDRMVKVGIHTIEAGVDIHWFNMRQIVMPLMIRMLSPDDGEGKKKIIKVVQIQDLNGHLYILLALFLISFIVFIIEYLIAKNSSFNNRHKSLNEFNYENTICYQYSDYFHSYKRKIH